MNCCDWKCCRNKIVLCFSLGYQIAFKEHGPIYFFKFYAMFKNLVFLRLLTELLPQGICASFQPTTANNRVLVGHVFQQLHAEGWFNCIQACHDEARCISYNYNKSASENGLCELSNAGLDWCNKEQSLVYSMGFVFQQLRKEKVSLSVIISALLMLMLFQIQSSDDVFIEIFVRCEECRKLQQTRQIKRYWHFQSAYDTWNINWLNSLVNTARSIFM